MSKRLTAAAVAKLRAGKTGREVPDGTVPGMYLDIRSTGSKAFVFRYRRPDGRPAKMTIGSVDVSGKENGGDPVLRGHLTLAAARVLATEARRQVALGRDPGAEHLAEKERRRSVALEKASTTFSACAARFIAEHRVPKKGRKPRNWREVARILGLAYPQDDGEPTEIEGGLASRWRDKPISEIDGHDVHSLIDEARRRGVPGLERRNEGISDARGRRMADALGSMFGWLLQHRRIAVDPTVGVWKPPAPAARERVLNCKPDVRRADELRWFWSACGSEKVGPTWGTLFRVLLATGLRRDEVGEMQWRELSDDLSVLRLDGSRTKNGRPHSLSFPPLVRDLLHSLPKFERCPWVFSLNGETRVGGYAKAKKRLDEAMLALAREECGPDASIPEFRLHDLRRSAATAMVELGTPIDVVEQVLNHQSGTRAGVAGTYIRATLETEKAVALRKWAEHIERAVKGESAKVVTMPGRARS
jgi:integrase